MPQRAHLPEVTSNTLPVAPRPLATAATTPYRLPATLITPHPKIVFPSVFLAMQPTATIPHPSLAPSRAIVKTGRPRPLA
jgi:hypothetical protein